MIWDNTSLCFEGRHVDFNQKKFTYKNFKKKSENTLWSYIGPKLEN